LSWQRVLGHDNLVRSFEQAVGRGRLAHAYLFAGPSGVGKRLFAEELAKTLLCEGRLPDRFEACDQCPACIQVAAGTHPDLFRAARPAEKLEFPIEVMRELCRGLGMKAARGRGKVAIVDDADDLNEESANCFLKTLEEPPPGSLLLLIARSADRQLATILSRCQVIHFKPLPEELVAQLVIAHEIEDRSFAQRLARLSNGSPGQALALADPALWQFRRQFIESLVKVPFDSVAVSKTLTQFVEEAGKESAAQRQRAALVLGLVLEFINGCLAHALGAPPSVMEPEDQPLFEQMAARADPEQLLSILDRCLEAEHHVDRRVQLVLALEAWADALGQLQAN
jgi:DNA polymerase-3 subunit delta'